MVDEGLADRRAANLARFRRYRQDGIAPMLEQISQAGSQICALCAVGHGGDWLASQHVEFVEADCMVCGKRKLTCSAAHWAWS